MRATQFSNGSAGDADYGTIGINYARFRQPDPHIAGQILAALGNAQAVLNVGAGAGSYEPRDRRVTAVEPSATMRAQRPPDLSPAIDAVAEDLPFPDQSFDAAMASSTVHQWHDLAEGIGELVRVTRSPIVILASDPALLFDFWMAEYLPEALQVEAGRFPPIATLTSLLGPETRVEKVDIPLNCTGGFAEAYYGRPERFLDPGVRGAMSSFTFVERTIVDRAMERLAADLTSGEWDRHHGHLRSQPFFDGSLRLIIRP
jgi:SAM-dependent methyltransferase